MKTKNERDSRFELLRIIAILFIVASHLGYHGVLGGGGGVSIPAINIISVQSLTVGGKLGVDIFLLITGYFMIDGKFKFHKLIKLLLEVFFYSFVIYLLFVIFGKIQFDWTEFAKNVFPTTTKRYWFVTPYIIMYILSPFINKLIKALNKKELVALIIILLLFQSAIGMYSNSFSSVGWFITLYLISAYIKLYSNRLFDSFKWSLIIFLVLWLIMSGVKVIFNINLASQNNIVCVICAVSLFCTFKNIKKPIHSKFINIVASTTFGIYLIHDNYYVRSFLWQDLLDCPYRATQSYFWLFTIGACLGIFVACSLIDLVRQYALEKPIMKLVGKAENSVIKKWKEKQISKQKNKKEDICASKIDFATSNTPEAEPLAEDKTTNL